MAKPDYLSETRCPNCDKKVYTKYYKEKAFCSQNCRLEYENKKRLK